MTPNRNLWDYLPTELRDMVFRMTDLETAVKNDSRDAVSFFTKQRRYRRQLEWADAARNGRVWIMEYMLRHRIPTTHAGRLIEAALLQGQLGAASFLLTNLTRVTSLLWPPRRQRWHNRQYDERTLELLMKRGRWAEAEWLLGNTSVPATDAEPSPGCPPSLRHALRRRWRPKRSC